ncbi:MAG: YihY/virulence factor BrkB family protein [Chitinispirillales bacterium]|jgi:membrane protein|nr:YihY/virulence factor BrkB family protein [Chitinispirillales bacterium]
MMKFLSSKISWIKKQTEPLQDALSHYASVNASTLAAALSYNTLFSLAPLFVIAVAIVGFVYGKEVAEGRIIDQLSDYIGPRTAEFLRQVITKTFNPASGIVATAISGAILIGGASTAFSQLRLSLGIIWNVKRKKKLPLVQWVKMNVFPFLLVIMSGFVLLASMIVSSSITFIENYLNKIIPVPHVLWQTASFLINLGIITGIFALVFKFVSNAFVAWIPVLLGAFFTASLFSVLRIFLVFYFSHAAHLSVYGAAASLVILLLWLNYIFQVIFLGAEFIRVYSIRSGRPIRPSGYSSFTDARD